MRELINMNENQISEFNEKLFDKSMKFSEKQFCNYSVSKQKCKTNSKSFLICSSARSRTKCAPELFVTRWTVEQRQNFRLNMIIQVNTLATFKHFCYLLESTSQIYFIITFPFAFTFYIPRHGNTDLGRRIFARTPTMQTCTEFFRRLHATLTALFTHIRRRTEIVCK